MGLAGLAVYDHCAGGLAFDTDAVLKLHHDAAPGRALQARAQQAGDDVVLPAIRGDVPGAARRWPAPTMLNGGLPRAGALPDW